MAEGGFEMDDAAAFGAADDDLDDEAWTLDALIDAVPWTMTRRMTPRKRLASLTPCLLARNGRWGMRHKNNENLREAVNGYYGTFAKDGLIPLFIDYANFKLVEGKLRLKAYPDVRLISKNTKKPLALRSIYAYNKKVAGAAAITSGDGLGFVDWTYADPKRRPPRRSKPLMKLAQVLLDEGSPHRSKQPSSKRLLMTLPQLLQRVILILSMRLSMKSTAEIMATFCPLARFEDSTKT